LTVGRLSGIALEVGWFLTQHSLLLGQLQPRSLSITTWAPSKQGEAVVGLLEVLKMELFRVKKLYLSRSDPSFQIKARTSILSLPSPLPNNTKSAKMPAQDIPFSEIKPEFIAITPPKRNKNNGLTANVIYKNAPFPQMQTPKMPLPFGLGSFTDKEGMTKYSFNLSFRYQATNPAVGAFYDKLKAIDQAIVKQLADQSQEWFQKKYSPQFIEELFRSAISPSKNPQYSDTFKVKLNDRLVRDKDGKPVKRPDGFFDVKITTNCYNQQRERVDITSIGKGDSIVAVVQPGQVYLAGKNIGELLTSFEGLWH
jgi:hypothetical protein